MDTRFCINKSLIALLLLSSVVFFGSVLDNAFAASTNESAVTTETSAVTELDSLPADSAFKITAKKLNNQEVMLNFEIAPGHQLYYDHFQFKTLSEKPFSKANNPNLPTPVTKQDEFSGAYQIYENNLAIVVPLPAQSSKNESQGFRVQYQGCAVDSFCYPPQYKEILISKEGVVTISDVARTNSKATNTTEKTVATSVSELTPSSAAITKAALVTTVVAKDTKQDKVAARSTKESPVESETDHITNILHSKALPMTLLMFLGLGIVLSLTPCVLPMVPILANILVGQDEPLSKKRSLYLAGLYVLSVSLCYAGAGIAAGLLGSHLQTTLQQPLFLIILSFLLLLFALNQFNMLHVQFPSIFSNALHQLERKQKHGSAIGAVCMGAISALMVSPCVTPALVGALTYIGQTGNAWLGGAALFALALGMGIPLLVVASIGSHLLPKAGPWMRHIKYFTGILLLVLAGSILMRALPNTMTPAVASTHSPFIAVRDVTELSQALTQAKKLNKPVILDVYADWCVSCRQMDKEVFENRAILQRLSQVHLLRLDLTQQNQSTEQLQKELGIIGPPMVLFFGPDGEEMKSYRMAGKSESAYFIDHLSLFLKDFVNRRH